MGMSLGGGSKRKGSAAPEMNVTPLVDVVLVLLIIFMVITPLLTKQFWVNLPDKKEEEEPPPPDDDKKEPVVVTVTKSGEIRINKNVISDDQFSAKLKRVLAARQDRTIFFDAHDEAPYARAATALDLARAGGAATIAVATESIVKN